MLAGVLAGAGEDLRGQQVQDRAVLVGRPDGAVPPQEAGAGTLFAAEAERAIEQPGREPLEADRHLGRAAGSGCCTTRSIRLLLTSVLPTLACAGQSGRWVSRYRIATAR